jgi:predicted ABC-type ATPase
VPKLVIVAGPNGSGKTTLVRAGALAAVLSGPAISLNADDLARDIAQGGHPTEADSLEAAQRTDARLDSEIAAGRSVLVETVLSSDKFKSRVATARAAGFEIILVYVSVKLPELNVARVATRILQGGHTVPYDRILARRARSHAMFGWFARAADQAFVFDNSTTSPTLAAFKVANTWALPALDSLSADLADTLRQVAAPG